MSTSPTTAPGTARLVGPEDVADIAAGAAVLGTGGGGDPYIASLLARAALAEHGPVQLVALDDVPQDAAVFPVGMMGAPTVMLEKLPPAGQAAAAVRVLAKYLARTPTHVSCVEIGGLNALLPLAAAAELGLPVVDGDGMGRAFPELQMVLPTTCGVPASPMSITDEKGNGGVFETADSGWAERLARAVTIEMGCSSTISLYSMTGEQARRCLVPGSVSTCARLGRRLREARAAHEDPVAAVVEALGGRELFAGTVVDVARRTVTGFARGTALVEGRPVDDGTASGTAPGSAYGTASGSAGRTHVARLEFQNEHLVLAVAEAGGGPEHLAVTVPDLICVLEADTGTAVTTERLRYGQRVRVVAAPADPRWQSPEGLALVGPRYFGYDTDPVRVGGSAAPSAPSAPSAGGAR